MADLLMDFMWVLLYTLRDILPILLLVVFFQLFVLKQPIPHLKRVIQGGIYVVLGLALLSCGIGKSAFSCGENYGHSVI